MSWVQLSDTTWRDVRMAELSDGAFALHIRALTWSADQLTDGFIPDSAIRLFRTRKRSIEELVSLAFWRRAIGGWLAVSWRETNRSKDQVLAHRAKQKQRYTGVSARSLQDLCAAPDPDPDPDPIKSVSESARASAGEAVELSRRKLEAVTMTPVVKAPPSAKAAVWGAFCRISGILCAAEPPRLQEVVSALEAQSRLENVPLADVAERVFTRWCSEPWPREHRFPFRNLADRLTEYLPPPVIPIPMVLKQELPPRHQTFQELSYGEKCQCLRCQPYVPYEATA